VFSIYKDASGGSAVYVEGPVAVAVKGGLFTHQIGSKTALTAAALAGLPTAFLGMKIDSDAELPRLPINSTPFALRAGLAEGVDCTGCIAAQQLDPNILKDFTKTADLPAVSKSGKYADLIGAPAIPVVSAAGKSGSYADLTDAPVLGKVATSNKYSDLTGLPTLAAVNSACGSNLVVKGIKADGSLDCVAAGGGTIDVKNLPADGIDEISNGLIWNQFNDTVNGKLNLVIDDNKPTGTSDVIAFPNIGIAQKLTVNIDIKNSDVSSLSIKLFDPNGVQYDLCGVEKITVDGALVIKTPCGTGTTFKASFPAPKATEKGDLTTWIGKNLAGNWSITVIDSKFLDNITDGTVNWSITLQTLSNKKIAIAGDLTVAGSLSVAGSVAVAGSEAVAGSVAVAKNLNVGGDVTITGKINGLPISALGGEVAQFRWVVWSTYDQWQNWFAANNTQTFGGVNPSNWTDGNAQAAHISANKELQRTFFNKKGYGGKNANVWSDVWYSYSSTNSRMSAALFRVKNTTASAINWTVYFWYSSYYGWSEVASASLNGASNWVSNNDCGGSCNVGLTFSIPANRVSTVIVVSASSPSGGGMRGNQLLFFNDCLALPSGLEFVDDLHTAVGGYEQ